MYVSTVSQFIGAFGVLGLAGSPLCSFLHGHRLAGYSRRQLWCIFLLLVGWIELVLSMDSEHINSVVPCHVLVRLLHHPNRYSCVHFQRYAQSFHFFVVDQTIIQARPQLSLVTPRSLPSRKPPPYKSTMGLPSASIMTTQTRLPTSNGSLHPPYLMVTTLSR